MKLPLNTNLTGKVAVITGAAGTLCSVFSKALAASGAKVALLGRTYANVQKLADEIAVIAGGRTAHRGTTEEILPLILADTLGGCPVLNREEARS